MRKRGVRGSKAPNVGRIVGVENESIRRYEFLGLDLLGVSKVSD